MSKYLEVSERFKGLCVRYGIPVPVITTAFPADHCDYTDEQEVRINVTAAGEMTSEDHALHLFGHYLCDLHCGIFTGGVADRVADVIAGLVERDNYHDSPKSEI